jgi:phage-related protein
MGGELKKVPARFYRGSSGTEPLRDWLLGLSKEDRSEIGKDIATVEYGWPIGMPTCAPLGAGLYEVRTNLQGNRTARILFCFSGGGLVLLHGFIKKTRKTPQADLDLARQRQREVER